jgi:hypothetical protein
MFPAEWGQWLLYGLIGVTAVMGLICFFPKLPNFTRILSMILNILLCICLGLASWYLPHVRAQIEKAFTDIPTEGEAEINFYVLKDEYKPLNEDGSVKLGISGETLEDYKDGSFLVQETIDPFSEKPRK